MNGGGPQSPQVQLLAPPVVQQLPWLVPWSLTDHRLHSRPRMSARAMTWTRLFTYPWAAEWRGFHSVVTAAWSLLPEAHLGADQRAALWSTSALSKPFTLKPKDVPRQTWLDSATSFWVSGKTPKSLLLKIIYPTVLLENLPLISCFLQRMKWNTPVKMLV